jgi:hypothetical protein
MNYPSLKDIKQHIRSAQAKAALAVNTSLIQLYRNLCKMIAENQALFEGRNNYVEQLVKDLRAEFHNLKLFSRSNLFYIRKFYKFYASSSVQQLVGLNETIAGKIPVQQPAALSLDILVQQVVGFNIDILSIPWGHHVVVLDKVKTVGEGLFYLQQTIEHNWSRAILPMQAEIIASRANNVRVTLAVALPTLLTR